MSETDEQTNRVEQAQTDEADSPEEVSTRLERRHEIREEKRLEGDLRSMKARAKAEKLIARVSSGLIYVVAVIACNYLGPTVLSILIAVMSWMCASELMHMMRLAGRTPNEVIGLTAAVAFPLIGVLPGYFVEIACFLLSAACVLWYLGIPKINILDVAVTLFVPLYTGLLFSSIVNIRAWNPGFPGFMLTFAVFGCIWLSDSLAFFVGTRFGKHKMAPRISPKKSWEGFAGGMVGAVLAWVILYFTHTVDIKLSLCLALGVLVGAAGVLGDLFESRIKRGVGVKDSGNVMPGHGGLLDRSDSLLFGCVVAEFILRIGGVL